jgi:SAM-dependent methyltransferase
MMPRVLRRLALISIVRVNAKAKRLAIRLTRWTGKSAEYVHPKHLLADTDAQYWYLAHVGRGDDLLDVGCGNAMHTLKVARRCRAATGIDRSVESLGVGARRAGAERASNVRLVCGDVEASLPFRAARFDTVLCSDLLEHVIGRDHVLGEIRRVLRPGGHLLLAVPNRATRWKRRLDAAGLFSYSDPDHKIEYTLDELRDELARNGFDIVRLEPSVYDTPWIGMIDVIGGLSLAAYRRLSAHRRRLAAARPEENAGFYAVCVSR